MDNKTPRPTASLARDNAIALQKHAVGQPVRRKEDDTLVRGKGRYTDDFSLPGQAHAWMVRSSHAHGVIRAIDTSAARQMPGVLGIYVGKDLVEAGYTPIRCSLPMKNADGSPLLQSDRMALAIDKVRFVGDPVACVVAETAAQARDAAEAVIIEIDELPSVTKSEDAIKPGAPLLYDHIPNNIALDYYSGDRAATAAAFAKAAHVTSLDIINTRVAVVPMEPRAGLASYDKASGRFTVHVATQGVSGNVASLAKLMNVPREKIRLLTYNVGGSFGMKNASYPEYVCLLHASRQLNRPVKWLDERSMSFLSDNHGRAQDVRAELALDARGVILGVRVTGFGNLGAYVAGVGPLPLSLNIAKNIASVYRTPLIEVDIKCVVTNTTFMGAYRGAGRPEANYFMERL
ncbi:MAG: xanthine dehydrogenase family protein molybdopterin-binding subunit, partial [Rhizobiales bacterium]|nr:xanthine dehydrogenase family protein molybdopterin-binding subunit [Hyphomicrobiales bacterium]